jgi:ribosomal protein L40E
MMTTATRCPQCGALLGTGAQWCTQCYADLRPPAPEPAAPAPESAPGSEPGPATDTRTGASAAQPDEGLAAGTQAGAPAARSRHRAPGDAAAAEPGWPCPRCGTVNDLAAAACSSCGSGFLADLAADRGIPAVPALTGLSRGARLGVALAAVVGFLVLLGAVFWLVG